MAFENDVIFVLSTESETKSIECDRVAIDDVDVVDDHLTVNLNRHYLRKDHHNNDDNFLFVEWKSLANVTKLDGEQITKLKY